MSADLFAAFETPSQASNQQNQQNTPQGVPQTANDPFLFLSTPVSAPQPHNAQWLTLQQHATSQSGWGAWPAQQVTQPQNTGSWGDIGTLGGFQSATAASVLKTVETQDDDDDAWGDFEIAPTNAPQPPPAITSPKVETLPPRTRVTRASTIDLMTNKLVDLDLTSSTLEPWQERPSWEKKETAAPKPVPVAAPKPTKASDPNVLFDADDFELQSGIVEEDDEFGDFETGAASVAVAAPAIVAAPAAAPASSALDLLSSLDSNVTALPHKKQPPGLLLSSASLNSKTLPYPQAPKSPYGLSFQNRKPEQVKALQVKTPLSPEFPKEITKEAKDASPTPVTAWPGVEEEGFGDDWDEFKDLPESKPKPKPVNAKPTKSTTTKPADASSDWDWNAWGDSEAQTEANPSATRPSHESAPAGPPPTNIPPPSILLSIFPQLLDLASTSLLKPINNLPNSSQQRVLADTATAVFLRGYLAVATVAARIIAGRKQRWHRDKFLMQGMSISAAAVGGGKTRGMKLAGVDKAQAARDDREAAEVASIWKQQVGRLRTAVAAVNGSRPGETPLKVPELGVTMVVQTAQGFPTAAKACVVCGLKREERVAKVDFDVEDSFGEWWIEFWGHRDCRNFWLEHEVKLRQR